MALAPLPTARMDSEQLSVVPVGAGNMSPRGQVAIPPGPWGLTEQEAGHEQRRSARFRWLRVRKRLSSDLDHSQLSTCAPL